jgi:CheY-like chemotaxis protein
VNSKPQSLILIVDDQEEDQAVLAYNLDKIGVKNPILSLKDGHEAIHYLKGDGIYTDRKKYPLPEAIFLDLQMPAVSGWDVLEWVRNAAIKPRIPIFIYSHPSNVGEVQKLYRLGADSFVRKPIDEIELAHLIHHFPRPWIMSASSRMATDAISAPPQKA